MTTITEEIKGSFKKGSAVTKLIYINLAVFIIVKLMYVFFALFVPAQNLDVARSVAFQRDFLIYLMLPADGTRLLMHPWTLITYMFLHFEFLHILGNLLWLFWFGRIFLKYLTGRQVLTTYLAGGLFGAGLFILSYNIFPGLSQQLPFAVALGASASITAIVMAISFYAPNYEVYIPFLGPVRIKYIALIFIVWDLLQIASENAGGHIAHLGGAIYGCLFAIQLKKGRDIGAVFDKILHSIIAVFQHRPKMKVTYKKSVNSVDDMEYNAQKTENQKELDRILDKIAQYGYDSLSKKEKETLFKMSK